MNIIGLDSIVFGVDDVAACCQYMTDYGLIPESVDSTGGLFKGKDGTSVEIRARDDASLPAALETGATIRKTIYGVADDETVAQIKAELSTDREVKTLADGSIETVDDLGFAIGFRVTVRTALEIQVGELSNLPGAQHTRPVNHTAVCEEVEAQPVVPTTLSHIVYFVPDRDKMEAFYRDRLGFRVVDRFSNLGPFMRPQGMSDHHSLFFIQTPPFMQGVEHFTFHVSGPTELLRAGKRFQDLGYESFWGPGRHIFGSNWFWYFNSPMGVHVEYDADMDMHDDDWEPRVVEANADRSQIFHFNLAPNFQPGGPS